MGITALQIVSATTTSYVAAFIGSGFSNTIFQDQTTTLKAISSFHSILTAICATIALSQPWPLRIWNVPKPVLKPGKLNDYGNPIIFGQNDFGNAITALETGFLLYDTFATLVIHYQKHYFESKSSLLDATIALLRNETITLWHHLTILSALLYFQIYCIHGDEKGIWIIVLFILMNASTPIMQLRWWNRQRTGHSSLTLDIMFCGVFGACRLGTIIYMFAMYGQYHGISTVQAFTRQEWICQISTGSLFALNAVWWLTMFRNTARKIVKSLQSR